MSFVGIFCVQRDNIEGGVTEIYHDPEKEPLLHTVLQENQFIIVNDQRFFHYASATAPIDPKRPAVRDVFVLTA